MTSIEALDRIKGFDKTRYRSAIEYLLEQEAIDTCFEIVEKELKTLEIIKKLPKEEKQVLLNAVYTYTKNEEEYDLLEEVLK